MVWGLQRAGPSRKSTWLGWRLPVAAPGHEGWVVLSPATDVGSRLRLGAQAPELARGFRQALPTRESTQVCSRDVEEHLAMTCRVGSGVCRWRHS